jgi:hypothetical protein
MASDGVYDFEYRLKSSPSLLDNSQRMHAEDREEVKAFVEHVKANGVSPHALPSTSSI